MKARNELRRAGAALLALALAGACSGSRSREPGVVGIEVTGGEGAGVERSIPPEALLAYAAEGDPFIYVAEGREAEVAAGLGAEVDGPVWTVEEDGGQVRRERRVLNPRDYYPRVLIARWTYLDGYRCEEKPAGFWLNILEARDGRHVFVRSYRTTEQGWWCITARRERCKILFKEVEGTFWTRPEGGGEPLTEQRKLSACAP